MEKRTTFLTVESFIRSHLDCCLLTLVVDELDEGQVLALKTLKIQDIGMEHVFERLIGALRSVISLGTK